MNFRPVFLLSIPFFSVAFAQDANQPLPAPRPVGIKITRPGVSGIAGTPPVGGTLVVYGYSMEEPTAGARLQGVSGLYEFTVQKRLSLFLTTTEPLVRDGHLGFGDTCPGLKVRLVEEKGWHPIVALAYSVKVPTATAGFGNGWYDHKLALLADKSFGWRTRWTGNFATTWAAQKDGSRVRQYMPSVAAVTRWHGRFGTAVQTYWTTAGKGYGGFVVAPFVQVKNTFNVFAGVMRNVGCYTTRYGLVAGFNYIHRPKR